MGFTQGMMILTGLCYAITAVGWYIDGKGWMGLTFFLYALTAGTLYMAGRG